jgi:hypothetical protein
MPINPKLVHVYRLTDPIEGRAEGAWVIQYHGEAFLTDPGGGNAEPFAWKDQPHEVVGFEAMTREEIAGQLRINPAMVDFVGRTDSTFPAPLLTFREGPIWSADAVAGWAPTPSPLPARDRSTPQ